MLFRQSVAWAIKVPSLLLVLKDFSECQLASSLVQSACFPSRCADVLVVPTARRFFISSGRVVRCGENNANVDPPSVGSIEHMGLLHAKMRQQNLMQCGSADGSSHVEGCFV
jgi:hypothetical protein